ncbi:ImmA/IrrE family metallo-endopeptidase [Actinomycetospora soli]|uniref:ImmA/IrrE family metallo-endopeptidase n=1 Tax=Actinomycetospora soli TaxID=2893887 RepID=UPI001E36DFF5|nr:ImmA/IrrE family metallo-endopeptidase [Actinomycetospora soli]MCD2186188.1 ImmA/IrrE family metallo-endopeptidase [Actinomycetospora soli]
MNVEEPGLRFKWEWLPGDSMRSPELAATFARLEVYVEDECVTLVQDEGSGSSRRSIQVSLYPLAEWIAFSWWNLLANSRPARSRTRLSDRHSLRSSGDGFLWPDLSIVPEGSSTRISWRPDRKHAPGAGIRYLTFGDISIPSRDVSTSLSSFVLAVIDRLVEQDIRSTALQEEWAAIEQADAEEIEFCVAAARLGLDPYAEAPKYEKEILAAAEALPASVLPTFYDAVDPDRLDETLSWVSTAFSEISAAPADTEQLRLLRGVMATAKFPTYDHAWMTGWQQAKTARRAMGYSDTARFELDAFLSGMVHDGPQHRIRAAGQSGADPRRLVIFSRAVTKRSERFTLARCLWHQAASDDARFIVTDSYTDREKVERAFAAELLAPAAGIRQLLSIDAEYAQGEDIDLVAETFEVSTTVVEHQIQNQLVGLG